MKFILADIKSQILGFRSNLNRILVVVVIVVIILLVCVGLIAWEKSTEEVVPEGAIPQTMKAGEVGEIEEGKTLAEVNPQAIENPVRPSDTPMPPTVFDTKGEILSIGKDSVTVNGSGENFADQKSRTLTVKFTVQTITFEKGQKVKYVGLAGLNHLKLGDRILINSSENIRGKTEFSASYINKI